MRQYIDIDDFTDQILKHSIFDFMRLLRKRMPNTFKTESVNASVHEKSVMVRFDTKRKMFFSTIVDRLKRDMNLKILYSFSKRYGKVQVATLYQCNPKGESYLVYVFSGNYGLLDNVVMEFYNDYAAMYDKLGEEFRRYEKSL